MALEVKNLPANAGEARHMCLIHGSGRPLGEWLPTPVFFPGWRSLAGNGPQCHKESDMTEHACTHTHTHTHTHTVTSIRKQNEKTIQFTIVITKNKITRNKFNQECERPVL